MTLKEFFRQLPTEGWYINAFGHIIRDQASSAPPVPHECPISSLMGEDITKLEFIINRVELQPLGRVIVQAADNMAGHQFHHHDNIHELRRRLLKHCGLTE